MQPWSQPLLWPHPSGAVACDPYFGNVVLLMGYEGPNGSTTTGFQDESPSAHGFGNPVGAVIDTSQFKFGTSSVRLNNAAIIFGNSADWHFGSGQYTVECWFRPNSNPGQGFFVGQWLTVGNSAWVMNTGVSGSTLTWNMSPDGGTTNIVAFNGSWAFATGTWYHIAVDFDGTNTRGYVNGVMVGKYTTPVTIFTSSNNLGIGANSGATSFIVDGWMDELRITKGVARYASDAGFAVPTAASPRVACASLVGSAYAFLSWSSSGNQITVNFGATAFNQAIPSGFSAWGTTGTTWNPSDKSAAVTLSNGNLTAVPTAGAVYVRDTVFQNPGSGKFYFEYHLDLANTGATNSYGIGTSAATTGNTLVMCICNPLNGNILYNNTVPSGSPTLGALANGTYLCCAVDLVNKRMWFRANAGNWNGNATYNPATNVGGVDISSVFT